MSTVGFNGVNTLGNGATTIDLGDDINWSDEYSWSAVSKQSTYTLTGALVVEQAAKLAGRPITLESIDGNSGLLPRATLDTLKAWADLAAQQFTLTFRGTQYQVLFTGDAPITATPILYYGDPDAGDWYTVKLMLIEATL